LFLPANGGLTSQLWQITVMDVDFLSKNYLCTNCCPPEIDYSCDSFQLRTFTPQTPKHVQHERWRHEWRTLKKTPKKDKSTRAKKR